MTPHRHQLRQLLSRLLEDLAKQEEASQMLLAIQKRLTAGQEAIWMEAAIGGVTAVYRDRMRVLHPRILSSLKQLQAVLQEHQWGSPPFTSKATE